jgi:hypothetical protein
LRSHYTSIVHEIRRLEARLRELLDDNASATQERASAGADGGKEKAGQRNG